MPMPKMLLGWKRKRGEKEMSEKVLGFYKKDAKYLLVTLKDKRKNPRTFHEITIEEPKLVSVRLASESVDLKELKEIIEKRIVEINKGTKNFFGTQEDLDKLEAMKAVSVFELNHLLSWAEKEVKRNE